MEDLETTEEFLEQLRRMEKMEDKEITLEQFKKIVKEALEEFSQQKGLYEKEFESDWWDLFEHFFYLSRVYEED